MKDMVKISNLNQTFYTKDGELEVLKNINFNLTKGQILTILGPSGSGKSTILNILTNLLKPTSGDVVINGKVGYMFQKDHLLEWRTIMDNITIGLEIQKKKTDESIKRVERLLKTYDLWDFRNMYPKELSGGMRQRVALIRTLAVDPDILLLDEPFSALDYQTRILVSDDVYRIIKNEGKSAILVTHDISEAISMSDKIVVLSRRPACVKSSHEINLVTEGEKTPLKTRKVPQFQQYFDILWKELDSYEIKQ
ncbi:ABC transporter ATP-binding protein [Romboutsia ilealis]|uniref:ABC transporter ATP-binding protein n=1 Tax=Romboutsia ilealis TaxID=1115758 RepID=UPI002573FB37|nr:ABC transporter ATP-binding protein [Romboutsia ilealis]